MSHDEQRTALALWNQELLRVNNLVNHNLQPSTNVLLNNSLPVIDHNNNQNGLLAQDNTDNIIKSSVDDYISSQGQAIITLTSADSNHYESLSGGEHQVYSNFLVPDNVADYNNYELNIQANTLDSTKYVSDQDGLYVASHLPLKTILPHNNLIDGGEYRFDSYIDQPAESSQIDAERYASEHVQPSTSVEGDNSSLPIKSEICDILEKEVSESSNRSEICDISEKEVSELSNRCEICGKSGFSTKGNLKRHQKSHSGVKPFQCDFCESSFTENKSLKIHLRRHTGEKPYSCTMCDKSFSQSAVLKSHMDLHNNQRNFECNKCDKAFRQRSQLRLHLMRHDGVKRLECPTCMAKFITKADLDRHRRIHTGERPYVCDVCKKTFTRQQSLNEHLNRHVGAKPYSCKHCDKTFSEKSACFKHTKTHEMTGSFSNIST